MATIRGNKNNNTLTGSNENNSIYGFGGLDTITGGTSADLIYGDSPDPGEPPPETDPVTTPFDPGNDGADNLSGGDGADTIYGGGGTDTLVGGAGNDALDGGYGADTLTGGAGADQFFSSNPINLPVSTVDVITDFNRTQGDTLNLNKAIFTELDLGTLAGSAFLSGANVTSATNTSQRILYNTTDGRLRYDADGSGSAFQPILFARLATGSSLGAALQAGDIKIYFGSITATSAAEAVDGSAGNDTIYGLGGNDTLYGFDGNDSLLGATGNDVLFGGLNNDVLLGGAGDDTADGGSGADQLSGGAGNDSLFGGTGNDTISGGEGNDSLLGGDDADTISGGLGNDQISGDAGDDSLLGGDGADTLNGGDGADVISGEADADVISGGLGNDTISGGLGNDQISGDAGDDSLLGGDGADTLNGGDGADVISGEADADVISGGLGNDTISGGLGNDQINGDAGDDSLLGGDGADTLNGGDGADVISGEADADVISGGLGNDTISGGDANDTLSGGAGRDTLNGGDGVDLASYDYSTAPVTASLATGLAVVTSNDQDRLISIENLLGGSAGDSLSGNANANSISGGAGNDTLAGGGGNDTLNGGAGNDTASFLGYNVPVIVDLSTGSGFVGGDTFTFQSIEIISGGNVADDIAGDSANNTLSGGAGNDLLSGRGGDDSLNGGSGNDTLSGGSGNDTILGGTGTDTVDYSYTSGPVTVDLAAGLGSALSVGGSDLDVISAVENVIGSSDNDIIAGDDQVNQLYGESGNDSIYAAGGDDLLSGGDGLDTLLGGSGNDAADYTYASSGVIASIADGAGSISGAAGDVDAFVSIENLIGSAFDDELEGDMAGNTISGADGSDWISGFDIAFLSGSDTVLGARTATDLLFGNGGDDLITGGLGNLSNKIYGDDLQFNDGALGGNDLIFAGLASGDPSQPTSITSPINGNVAYGDADQMTGASIGGNDTLVGGLSFADAANIQDFLVGDAWRMEGDAVGGNDLLYGSYADLAWGGLAPVGSSFYVSMVGDAQDAMAGRAVGGNDFLYGSPGITSVGGVGTNRNLIIGDSYNLYDEAQGGDDYIEGGLDVNANYDPQFPLLNYGMNEIYGDAVTMYGATVAGNDQILGGDNSRNSIVGDAYEFAGTASVGNFIAQIVSAAPSVVAGSDVLVGGAGAGAYNLLVGDAFTVSAEGTVMGNDRLIGGEFAIDEMYGDVFVYDPAGAVPPSTASSWVSGADVFSFATNNGEDVIGDFESGVDLIELSVAGVSSFTDLAITVVNSVDSLITFSAGNTITVWNTATPTGTLLTASDFTFSGDL